MKNLAIIPARGGSKRIPRKNIKNFLGKPIIAYSIEIALQSGLFDEIMVSTDDDEIAKIAIQYGAKVPFMRSAKAADDYATITDVINEVLNMYCKNNQRFDNICCILATSPLITVEQLSSAYHKLIASDILTSIYPIVPFSYPIQRSLKMDKDGYVKMNFPKHATTRSQDLEIMYHDAGAFYWHKVKSWKTGELVKGGFVLDEINVQDIDTENDWKLAELKYSVLNKK